MIFYVCMNGTQIVGNSVLGLAKNKAKELKSKYPDEKITVEWSSWCEGTKEINIYHTIEIQAD